MLRVLVYDPIMEGSWYPATAAHGANRSQERASGGGSNTDTISSAAAKVCAQASPEATVTADIKLVAKKQSPNAEKTPLPKAAAEPNTLATTTDNNSKEAIFSRDLLHRRPQQPTKQLMASAAGTKANQIASATPGSVAIAAASPAKPSILRRYLALQAVFLVSGAWHALIFYNNTHTWGLRWLLFFTIQAPICTLEAVLRKYCQAAGIKVPRLVAMVLTQASLTWMSAHLFLGPLTSSGMEARIMEVPNMARVYLASTLQQGLA
jgi:hypothetical protein